MLLLWTMVVFIVVIDVIDFIYKIKKYNIKILQLYEVRVGSRDIIMVIIGIFIGIAIIYLDGSRISTVGGWVWLIYMIDMLVLAFMHRNKPSLEEWSLQHAGDAPEEIKESDEVNKVS